MENRKIRTVKYHLYKHIAVLCRIINERLYMRLIIKAYKQKGVIFNGTPRYIHSDAFLDASGGLEIGKNVVISTKSIILSHDYSFLKKSEWGGDETQITKINKLAFKRVSIDENSFIGAGAIVLPGSTIGKWCIIGAGTVVKGRIEDYAIVIGNPAKVLGSTK